MIDPATEKINFGVSKQKLMEQIRYPLARALIPARMAHHAQRIYQEDQEQGVSV
ncbi:MAG: hypothetical protein ACLQPD_03850 [Desulfomonilaceae bacterium]